MPDQGPGRFEVKDSGERTHFDSGMQRDTEEGKVDYTYVLKGPMLERWAQHLQAGAEKYDRDNWMKANSEKEFERFQRSAMRHMVQWLNGERDEDHAAAVIFGINGAEYVRDVMMPTKTVREAYNEMTFIEESFAEATVPEPAEATESEQKVIYDGGRPYTITVPYFPPLQSWVPIKPGVAYH